MSFHAAARHRYANLKWRKRQGHGGHGGPSQKPTALFRDADTFYAARIMNNKLTPSHYVNPDTFYTQYIVRKN